MANISGIVNRRTQVFNERAAKAIDTFPADDRRALMDYLDVMTNKVPIKHTQGDLMVVYWLIGQLGKQLKRIEALEKGAKK